tara:strand:+ start:22725 stop:23741 length:1017 start_codon:yes stop_codon:yes gene_type:complete
MKNKGKTLIYLQDPGGTNFIKLSLKGLINKFDTIIVSHNLSAPILKSVEVIPDYEISSVVDQDFWLKFFKNNKITKIISTLSSKYVDLSNCNLIKAAKTANIDSLGFFDHWKGYDRLFEDGSLEYVTDDICVIDEFVKQKFISFGFSKDKLHKVGHPHLLNRLKNKKVNITNKENIKLCILSQPDTLSKSFESVFLTKNNQFISSLKNIIEEKELNIDLYLRRHPKENYLDSEIMEDPNVYWEDSLNFYDVFIGINSIALIEACLIGKKTFSIDQSNFNVEDDALPYQIFASCKTVEDLIYQLSNEINHSKNEKNKFITMLLDSDKKFNIVLENFLDK